MNDSHGSYAASQLELYERAMIKIEAEVANGEMWDEKLIARLEGVVAGSIFFIRAALPQSSMYLWKIVSLWRTCHKCEPNRPPVSELSLLRETITTARIHTQILLSRLYSCEVTT